MRDVTIVEVGARDGLQNEATPVSADVKVEFIERLLGAGVSALEVTSFVRSDRIPQLADAAEVAARIGRRPEARLIALTPNSRGLAGALAAGIEEVAIFAAASEEFSQRNINTSVAGSLEMFRPVAEEATAAGVRLRGYVSMVLGCPYQGDVPLADVVAVTEALFELGCAEVSLGDTIGVGAPGTVRSLISAVAGSCDMERLAFHGHDTYATGLANAFAAVEAGVRTIDCSAGGLGGCPYAGPQARGNVATEDVVYAFEKSGIRTGIDLDAMIATSLWMATHLGHPPRSAVVNARRK
jgi:hydroxymethylglutaryl-CoA lyase